MRTALGMGIAAALALLVSPALAEDSPAAAGTYSSSPDADKTSSEREGAAREGSPAAATSESSTGSRDDMGGGSGEPDRMAAEDADAASRRESLDNQQDLQRIWTLP